MRHNPNNRRSRGRSGRKGPNPLTRAFESNGPDVKVRGTAAHIAEKYMMLARDAVSSGDNVAAENYFQHAEHYNRIIAAAQAQAQAQQPQPDFRQRDGGDDESYEGERHMNGRANDYGRYNGGYQGDGDSDDDDGGEAPAPRHHAPQQQPPQSQAPQQQAPQRQAEQDQPGEQQPTEPERPRRRRRPRGEDQAEASAPRRNAERKAAGANGAAEDDEDTTRDGQAALAAFPD